MPSPLVTRLQSLTRNIVAREVPPFAIPALTSAVKTLGDCAIAAPPPSKDRLARLWARISVQLSEETQMIELSRSEWLDAPWLAFARWREHTLCAVPAFHAGLLAAAQASPTVAKRCILVFLRDYDAEAPRIAAPLGLVIRDALQAGHETLSGWVDRNRQFRQFAPDGGPQAVVAQLHSSRPEKPLPHRLDEVGMSGPLAHGGFSFGMLLAWCNRAHERPWENQEIIEGWMTQCSGPMAGREYRVVECLLNPWRTEDPAGEWRTPLLAWLQERYGDPRDAVAGVWPQVDGELRAIAVRWLTLQTIEGFFAVLNDYAQRRDDDVVWHQWRYRSAFWLAYYRRQVILDAKAVVGRDMEEALGWSHLKAEFSGNVGRIEAPDRRLCALLLRLNGLIVFVGTHNASCRIWDETSRHAPNLRRQKLQYSEIVTTPRTDLILDGNTNDTGIRHAGAENGTWQRKLRDFLRRRIGVSITDTELMP